MSWLSETLPPIIVVLLLDVVVTLVFFYLSGSEVKIGTLRPPSTVPPKLLELLVVGGAVGLLASLATHRLDTGLVTLGVAFVFLLDVDHLPSLLGVAQPIRPAHSFAFLAIEIIALGLAIRRASVVLIAVAAFFGHLAGDTGIFAPFQPFSFEYFSLSAYTVPLALGGAAFALASGYISGRERPRVA